MKKKIISALLCAAMVFTLAGCGGSSDDEDETDTQEEAEEPADEDAAEEDAEAEEEAEEETNVVDQVEEFRYMGTEDRVAFWNVYMKEDADYDNYDTEDYVEILKTCLAQPENKEDGAILYGIQGWTQDGKIIFSWDDYGTEDELRQIEQFKWREGQTNPDTYYWPFYESEVREIYSGLDEQE